MKEAIKDCFDEALKQIKCLNPSITLNLDGYDYRAFVKDRVLVPYDPVAAAKSEFAEDSPEGAKGADPEVGSSSKVVSLGDATPPSYGLAFFSSCILFGRLCPFI